MEARARPVGMPVPRRTAGRAVRTPRRGRSRPREAGFGLAACIAPALFLATGVALAVLFMVGNNRPGTGNASGQELALDNRLEAPKLRARASEASQLRSAVSAFADEARPAARALLQPLLDAVPGDGVAAAGLPRFPRIFARDAFITALLSNDANLLRAHLDHAVQNQGSRPDAKTGEEPGKIPHEWPGVDLNGHSTAFAAVDTTPLFLISLSRLLQLDGCFDGAAAGVGPREGAEASPHCRTWSRYHAAADRAVTYIDAHIDTSGRYVEDPSLAGADAFALQVTYWKDSALHERDVAYPATYWLAHAQCVAALRCATRLFGRNGWAEAVYLRARRALRDYTERVLARIRAADGASSPTPVEYAADSKGAIEGMSSDPLFLLFFAHPSEVAPGYTAAVARWAVQALESPAGFLTHNAPQEGYHARTVWPFEQAGIHAAAQAHGLPDVAAVAARVAALLAQSEGAPEYYRVPVQGAPEAAGCSRQLWTAGARAYFDAQRSTMGELASLPLPDGLRGVPPALAESVYRCSGEGAVWRCPSAPGTVLPCAALNDDYCDCPHGEDEPGTAACAHVGRSGVGFWCPREGESLGGDVGPGLPREEGGGTFAERAEKRALAEGLVRLDTRALAQAAASVPTPGRGGGGGGRTAFTSWWDSAQGKAALAQHTMPSAAVAEAARVGLWLPSSRVGDGVCDCAGCEDERGGAAAVGPGPTFLTAPAPALMVAGVAQGAD